MAVETKKTFKFEPIQRGDTVIKEITIFPPTILQKKEAMKKLGSSWVKVVEAEDPSSDDYDRFYDGAIYLTEQCARDEKGGRIAQATIEALPAWVVEESLVWLMVFTGNSTKTAK